MAVAYCEAIEPFGHAPHGDWTFGAEEVGAGWADSDEGDMLRIVECKEKSTEARIIYTVTPLYC
jgi:hypothetical protein